ncbi:EF hand domain protein [Talaromyces proteolyticus]|uniref:Actin cytoskeleton-regulatory complex protein END3 n=1 Tax=Talaromyces proteolyticus TaxID=1131652 RepID=A0AAD4KIG1_9EURO|nr:EF hand domain protein [Talaromyces proteolyticus]KAH8691128.1 EF hand domain protein [Talaromyces proteolyticus]
MSEPAHPNLNLTQEEKRVFFQLFQAADTTNIGVITGEHAVPFFEKTKLSPDTLGLIWQLADKENRGLLTPSGFSIVLRLIGHAQAGHSPTEELALQPGPLPRFEGISVSSPSRPSTASPPPAGQGGPVRVPPLSPEDVNKFGSLFEKSDTPNGVISGEIAKQIFERARLPNDVLGRIWNLSDTKQRGQLDATEFVIAMHLLTSYKTGSMRGIPSSLPPGLYEAASKRGLARTPTGPRTGSDVPPVPAIPTQFSGSQRTQSPLSRQHFASPLSAHSTGADWLITPQEKAQFDNIFATVDTAKAGIISGDQAVTFFTNAQLPEDVLAQIWDLADIDADGQLTKDEFAVAMYLVRQQRSRKEPLPTVLPPALIPPSMRRQEAVQARPAIAPAPVPAPVSVPAPPALPRSAAEDLFGLDTFTAPASTQFPQSTGGSNPAFQSPGSPSSRTSQQGPPVSTFKPFVPSSQFGQSLNPQLTGAGSTATSPPPASDDLLGDNDPEESKKLTQETTELANLSNQIGSLSKEMQNVQTQRASAEQEFTQSSQRKRDFEARLAQARAMYEKEAKDYKALEERLNASRAETKRLEQDYALIEGSRQDLQNQFNQVSAALATDQNENATLKEKIRQANAAVSQLKPALEKARSEARQQKGLVAINKKQLATVEGGRDKIQSEIESVAKENQDDEEHARPALSTADITSPALSTASQQTNPFFRRTTTETSDRAASPASNSQSAFDNLFGPSFASPSTSTPPPQTSFGAASPFAQQTRDVSKSPNTSGLPTPSVSPPPQATSEPPPLPQSRQITPSFLPLGNENNVQSTTSSTAVSPPASRFGGLDTSEAGTPAPSESASVARDIGAPSHLGNEISHEPSPFDEAPKTPSAEEDVTPSAASGHHEFQPTAEESTGKTREESFDELFGNVGRERSKSQKANDFEEAFAGMKPRSGETPNDSGEFPPIKEFEVDDDDDSTDSEAPMKFDDDFAPVSPQQKDELVNNESIDSTQLQAFPVPGSSVTAEKPPSPDAQRSPPSYDTAVPSIPGSFPAIFDGLLPSRSDPTLAPDAPHAVESSSGAPIVAGEVQKKSGAPDFDAAFAGLDLAPAKEEDDSEDEDEVESHTKKQPSDFDFSFDSPSQSAKATSSSSTQPAAPSKAAADFFNFDNSVDASTNQAPADEKAPTSNHDWDTIFAPLGNGKASEGGSNGVHPSDPQAASGSDKKKPGWALSADTGEDDLILKRLTGMGFPRDESLAALEKFDYNIDKAADYLSSRT